MLDQSLPEKSQTYELNSVRSSFTVGKTFNPHYTVSGFNPDRIVYSLRNTRTKKTLTQGQKMLYRELYDRAGKNGCCWPSEEYLSLGLGVTERQIRKDVIVLEREGFIVRERKQR